MPCNVTLAERVQALYDARLPDNAHRAALIALMSDITDSVAHSTSNAMWHDVAKPYWVLLAQNGEKINAIKAVRAIWNERYGPSSLGLRDAKDIVEMFFPAKG